MGNASFHKSQHLKTMIEKDRHILEYLPTYYPIYKGLAILS